MSEQIVYHEELKKAVATRLQKCEVFWEPQDAPRDICLGKLTARLIDNPKESVTMNYEVQRGYYISGPVMQAEIETFADDYVTHLYALLL